MSFKQGFLTIQKNFFSGHKEYLIGEKKSLKFVTIRIF
jgi:hypothetical protein